MGKKSRLKRQRSELSVYALSGASVNSLISMSENRRSVFRYFDEEWHADAFSNGEVWLSTLRQCRIYENSERGDSEEGYETYNSGYIRGSGDNPALVEIGRRCGVHIGEGCTNVTLNDNIRITMIPDAFVLCTTKGFIDASLTNDFGRYCVEIINPKLFFQIVTSKLVNEIPMSAMAAGDVIYADRFYRGLQRPPGPIGFVKPSDGYAAQNEYRFLWIPRQVQELRPFSLSVPEASKFCRRIR